MLDDKFKNSGNFIETNSGRVIKESWPYLVSFQQKYTTLPKYIKYSLTN